MWSGHIKLYILQTCTEVNQSICKIQNPLLQGFDLSNRRQNGRASRCFNSITKFVSDQCPELTGWTFRVRNHRINTVYSSGMLEERVWPCLDNWITERVLWPQPRGLWTVGVPEPNVLKNCLLYTFDKLYIG